MQRSMMTVTPPSSAIFAPWVAPADPYKTSMIRRLQPPLSPHFILGTDELGRDMLSRLLYGGRVSLSMGLAPVILATILGGSLGIIAGYFGRHVNMAIMRVVDLQLSFPSILVALMILAMLGKSVMNVVLALENDFNIEFTDAELPTLTSLPMLVGAIEKHLAS